MEQSLGPILRDADANFMGQSKLHETARALARLLDEEGIPYAIAGALALAVHGRVRLTEDVDVLLRKEDLAAFKQKWLGRGYAELDFLLVGDFSGDGKPKPVAFPD